MNATALETDAFLAACAEAERFVGATAPNPPVGAAALDANGKILAVSAHERAGTAHAEARVLEECRARGILGQVTTLVVTLEPCNHTGRTPPCTEAILATGIRRVVFGVADPNPRVAGGGAARLRAVGLEVEEFRGRARVRAEELLAPFRHWVTTGLPYVTVKTAHLPDGSMIPPAGQKTFTSESSLRFAHELRRRADAILTGSGTILADDPSFTVRLVSDHPGKRRWLVILDRRGRVSAEWRARAEARGFRVLVATDYREALRRLGSAGVLEVLVEAGPTLSSALLRGEDGGCLWQRHVVIHSGDPDRIEIFNATRPNEELIVHRHRGKDRTDPGPDSALPFPGASH